MSDLFASDALTALFQIIMIDLVLAGDNAIVIGLAAAGLPAAQRNKAILIGIGAATLLRVVLATHNHTTPADRRAVARGRHLTLVGVLENVARAAWLASGGLRPAIHPA